MSYFESKIFYVPSANFPSRPLEEAENRKAKISALKSFILQIHKFVEC